MCELVARPRAPTASASAALDDDLAAAAVGDVAAGDDRVAPAPAGDQHLERALARPRGRCRDRCDVGDLEPERARRDIGQRAHAPVDEARRPRVVEAGDDVGQVGAVGGPVEAGGEPEADGQGRARPWRRRRGSRAPASAVRAGARTQPGDRQPQRPPHAGGAASSRPSTSRSVRSATAPARGSWVTSTTARPPTATDAQQLEHGRPGRVVEVAGGLVGEHQRGLVDQRPRDRQPLLLAARELGRAARGRVDEPQPLDQRPRPRRPRGAARRWPARAAARSRPRSARARGGRTGRRGRSGRAAAGSGRARPGGAPALPRPRWRRRRGGRARPRTCSSVDFPEPDGPTTATSSPAATSSAAPSSTRLRAAPAP